MRFHNLHAAILFTPLLILPTALATVRYLSELRQYYDPDGIILYSFFDATFYDNDFDNPVCWFHGTAHETDNYGFTCTAGNIAMIAQADQLVVLYARPGFNGQFRPTKTENGVDPGGRFYYSKWYAQIW